MAFTHAWGSFENDFDIDEVRDVLSKAAGVVVKDDVANFIYPMPLTAYDKDDTFVGRIRRDETQPNTLNCWIVSDNLRKGAATNAVQIAEYLLEKELLTPSAPYRGDCPSCRAVQRSNLTEHKAP